MNQPIRLGCHGQSIVFWMFARSHGQPPAEGHRTIDLDTRKAYRRFRADRPPVRGSRRWLFTLRRNADGTSARCFGFLDRTTERWTRSLRCMESAIEPGCMTGTWLTFRISSKPVGPLSSCTLRKPEAVVTIESLHLLLRRTIGSSGWLRRPSNRNRRHPVVNLYAVDLNQK